MGPAGFEPAAWRMGDIQAYRCGLQGFDDRLYCMFNIPPGAEGTALNFELRLNDCEDPVYLQPLVSIPEPQSSGPVCTADLNEKDCEAVGGTFYPTDTTTFCGCP